ncbi:MAG: P-II family nitrogen regulator [Alphaproteobacteria bacterium]|nr:P-II family nitrogen regulator [Alphaproteobacteria bacterium]
MKRIEAIIQPHKLNQVIAALHGLPQFPGFTVLDAFGQGHGRGEGGNYKYDNKEGLLAHRRCFLVVFCEDDFAITVVNTVIGATHTGQAGDGLIGVVDVDALYRIGSSEVRA